MLGDMREEKKLSHITPLSPTGKTTLTMYLTFKYLISVVKYTQSDLVCALFLLTWNWVTKVRFGPKQNYLVYSVIVYSVYSTHHEIKNTPLVLRVFLWRYVPHCNSHNFWTARDRIFFLFLATRRKVDLQIIHTWHFCRTYPQVATPSFTN